MFRHHFHINATRELAAMHLMQRQQLSPKIFWNSSLSDVSAMLIRSNRISGIVTLADKPSFRASARQAEDTLILDTLSWAIMTKSHLFIHQHNLLRRRLLLLGQILVFNLGHKPNIRVDNELLGPRTLQINIQKQSN